MNIKSIILCSVFFLTFDRSSIADIVISIGNGSAMSFEQNQLGRASFVVFAVDDSAGSPVNLSDYGLALRLGNSISIPSGFTDFQVDFTGGLIPLAGPGSGIDTDEANLFSDTGPSAFNMFVNNSQNNEAAAISSNPLAPTKLFDISFRIGNAAPGLYSFQFVANAKSFNAAVNSATGTGFPEDFQTGTGPNLNQFAITAVPEPSSFVLATAVISLGCFQARRRFLKYKV